MAALGNWLLKMWQEDLRSLLRYCPTIGPDAMNLMFTPDDQALMTKIKAVFNTSDLCNPGKIFPSAKQCWETEHGPHLAAAVRSPGRGAAI